MKKIIICMLCLLTGYTASLAANTSPRDTATSYAALPVRETYVPNDVVENLKNQYGSSLYSITRIKDKDGNVEYSIVIKDNGTMKEECKKETSQEDK